MMPHWWKVLEIHRFVCWGKLFTGRCLIRNLRGVLWKADDDWKLLHRRSLVLWCCGFLPSENMETKKGNAFPPAMPLQHPLLRELQCQLAKNKVFKGSRPVFTEHAKKGEFGAER